MKTAASPARSASPFSSDQEKILKSWTERYPYPMMGLIEALRAVQEWHRRVSPEAEEYLAELFETTPRHVHEVATFFPYFTQRPTGKYRVGICHGLTCWLAGSDKAEACLQKTLGVKERAATADGRFSWETMECLGACDQAPALQVNERLKGKATDELIAKLAGELK